VIHLRLLALALLLVACSAVPAPKTPTQAILEGRAALGVAAAAFNVYASQRPFCNDAGAKPPPLCAERSVVIQGDKVAHQVAAAFDRAEVVVNTVGVADTQWSAVGEAAKQLLSFQSFVVQAKGAK
jgi:hypothetical protein